MAAILNFSKNILSIAKSFGIKAALASCADIARQKFINTRKHLLYALDPKDFIPTSKSFPDIEFSIAAPSELKSYTKNESFELSQEFLNSVDSAKVVVARNVNNSSLLAYGFFSKEQVAIAGDVIFEPPPASIYLFKFFVAPEARRAQLVRALVAKIIETEQAPISIIIAIIISANFISQAAFSAMGFKMQFGFLVRKGARALIKCSFSAENKEAILKRI